MHGWIVRIVLLSLACSIAEAQELCVTPSQYGPLPLGSTVDLQARDVDWLGDCGRRLSGVVWTSSDTAIAHVTAAGRIEPRRVGAVTIRATLLQRRGAYTIQVVPAIHRIEIFPRDTSVNVGDTVTFRAIAYDADGKAIPNVPFIFWADDDWRRDGVSPRWQREVLTNGIQVWSRAPSSGRVCACIVGDSAMARLTIR